MEIGRSGMWVVMLAGALAGPILSPAAVCSEESGGGGIAFLTILLTHDSVQLAGWTIVPGSLRPPRTAADRGNLEFEVLSVAGGVIWKGSIPDPTIRRLEYEDPDQPGRLRAKFITLDSAQCVVRLPADSAAARLTFYRVERKVEGPQKAVAVRRPLGSIRCPWREVKK